jgi:hypothetical protein
MAAGVSVDGGQSWLVAGRIVGRLFEQVKSRVPAGSAVAYELDAGLANNLLALDLLPPGLATEIRLLLTDTAAAEVAAVDADPSATSDDVVYRDALQVLLDLLAR